VGGRNGENRLNRSDLSAKGRLPEVNGRLPLANGRLPLANGRLPEMKGRQPLPFEDVHKKSFHLSIEILGIVLVGFGYYWG
jgi:hypothetical protein